MNVKCMSCGAVNKYFGLGFLLYRVSDGAITPMHVSAMTPVVSEDEIVSLLESMGVSPSDVGAERILYLIEKYPDVFQGKSLLLFCSICGGICVQQKESRNVSKVCKEGRNTQKKHGFSVHVL